MWFSYASSYTERRCISELCLARRAGTVGALTPGALAVTFGRAGFDGRIYARIITASYKITAGGRVMGGNRGVCMATAPAAVFVGLSPDADSPPSLSRLP